MENKNDSTIRTLKRQIKTLEELNNEKPEIILKQLSDIYDYLSLLDRGITSDMNYKKYYSVIFNRISSLPEQNTKNLLFLKIYFSLKQIFPESEPFLLQINADNKIFNLISTVPDINVKIQYYLEYTNKCTTFGSLSKEDIIKMYNLIYKDYLSKDNDIDFNIIKDLHYILFYFYNEIKTIEEKEVKLEKFDNAPYLFNIIASFIEIYNLNTIKYLYSTNKDPKTLDVIVDIMDSIFLSYFSFISAVHEFDMEVTQNIIALLCLFYSFLNTDSNKKTNGSKKLFTLLHKILNMNFKYNVKFLVNIIENLNTEQSKKMNYSVKSYIKYIKRFFQLDVQEYEMIFPKETTIFTKYDEYMSKLTLPNNDYNIDKGSLLLLTRFISSQDENSLLFNNVNYNPLVILETLSIYETKEKKENNLEMEILLYIAVIVQRKGKTFKEKEWELILTILNTISNQYIIKNKSVQYLPYIKNILEEITLANQASKIELKDEYDNILFNLLCVVEQKTKTPNKKLFSLTKYLTFYYKENLNSALLDSCLIKYMITDYESRQDKSDCFQIQIELLQSMKEIISKENNETKVDLIANKVIKYYPLIMQKIVPMFKEGRQDNSVSEGLLFVLGELIVEIIVKTKIDYCYKQLIEYIFYCEEAIIKDSKGNKEKFGQPKEYSDYQNNAFTKVLIRLNTIANKNKMIYAIDTLFPKDKYQEGNNKESKRFKFSHLALKILIKFDTNSKGEIIITDKDYEFEQKDPCLSIYKSEDKVYVDLNWVNLEVMKSLERYLKKLSTHSQTKRRNLLKTNVFLCNLIEKNLIKNNVISDGNITDIITLLLKNDNFEVYRKKYYQSLFHLIVKIFINSLYHFPTKSKSYIGNKSDKQTLQDTIIDFIIFYYRQWYKRIESTENRMRKRRVIAETTASTIGSNTLTVEKIPAEENKEEKLPHITIFELKRILMLLSFYFNSFNDNKEFIPSLKKEIAKSYEDNISRIINNIFFAILRSETLDLECCLIILSIMYQLKEGVRYCSTNQIIKCVYICLILGWPLYSLSINMAFSKYFVNGKYLSSETPCKIDILSFHLDFYYALCDNLTFYFLSYVDEQFDVYDHKVKDTIINEAPNEKFMHFYNDVQGIFLHKDDAYTREVAFKEMCNFILCSKNTHRDNILITEKKSIIKDIAQYKVISGDLELVMMREKEKNQCQLIVLTPVSNFKYTVLIDGKEVKENKTKEEVLTSFIYDEKVDDTISENVNLSSMMDYYMKKNKKYIEVPQDKMNIIEQIMNTSVSYHHTINIFYSKCENKELKINSILNSTLEQEKPSKQFISFISKLGDITMNEEGEKALVYKDMLYNIEYNIVNKKKTKEEKIKLIKEHNINILWIDNPSVDITNIPSLFDSISKDNQYTYIVITPVSDEHYLIRKRYNKKESQIDLLEDMFVNDYVFNVNAFSSIRYIVNFLIILSDWYYYHSSKKEEDLSNTIITKRISYFKSLNDNNNNMI